MTGSGRDPVLCAGDELCQRDIIRPGSIPDAQGDLPGLGLLFKHKVTTENKTELLIFLTPHIVQAPSQLAALSNAERQKSKAPNAFTEKELNEVIDNLPVKQPDPAAAPKGGKASAADKKSQPDKPW